MARKAAESFDDSFKNITPPVTPPPADFTKGCSNFD